MENSHNPKRNSPNPRVPKRTEGESTSESTSASNLVLRQENAALEQENQQLRKAQARLLSQLEATIVSPPNTGECERFRRIIENTRELIFLQKADGSLIYVNPSCRAQLGYEPVELLALPPNRLYHPEDVRAVRNHLTHTLEQGQIVSRLDYRMRHKDGHFIWFESDTLPSTDADAQPCLLTTSRDITKRKKMEEVFSRRAKELNCLLQITELVETHHGAMEDILRKVVEMLPSSWQHSHVASAQIVFRNQPYLSHNYRGSPWQQKAQIVVDQNPVGWVEVCYRGKMPAADEGPFTWEERRLLNAVADRLAGIIQRIEAEQELQKERRALRESNIAMRELMARIQEEKREIANAMQKNVDTVILPILETLHGQLPPKHRRILDLLRANLDEITSPYVDKIAQVFQTLSPAELRICDMIRRGRASKEIAQFLHISPSTVNRHREHIRQKLGLINKNKNLATYLNSLMSDRPAIQAAKSHSGQFEGKSPISLSENESEVS